MGVLEVEPTMFQQYGDITAGMATTVATAGDVDEVASVAAAVPAFGLIGQEFLGSFTVAQGDHFAAVNQLATVFANTSAAAHAAADAYRQTELSTAASFVSAEPVAR